MAFRIKETWAQFWRVDEAEPTPAEQQKLDAIDRLDKLLGAKSASVARLVLSEVKEQAIHKRSAHRTLENKAASVIGLAAIVLGFATTFNSSALLKIVWPKSFPVIIPALLLESAAIVAGVLALSSQEHSIPDALLYNHPNAIEDERNEARIAMALAQSWGIYERRLVAGNATRSIRLSVSMWLFVAGLFYTIGLASADVMLRIHAREDKKTSIALRQAKVPHLPPRIPNKAKSIVEMRLK